MVIKSLENTCEKIKMRFSNCLNTINVSQFTMKSSENGFKASTSGKGWTALECFSWHIFEQLKEFSKSTSFQWIERPTTDKKSL